MEVGTSVYTDPRPVGKVGVLVYASTPIQWVGSRVKGAVRCDVAHSNMLQAGAENLNFRNGKHLFLYM